MAARGQGRLRGARWLIWLMVVAVALVVVGIGLQLLGGATSSSTASGQPSPWRENLSFVVVMVAFVVIVAGVVRMVRAQVPTLARRDRVPGLSIGQRRQMGRWVRQGQAAPRGMAEATTISAQALAGQREAALFYLGFIVMILGQAVGAAGLLQLGLVAGAIVMVAGLALIRRDAHLAQRWLGRYGEPAASNSVAS